MGWVTIQICPNNFDIHCKYQILHDIIYIQYNQIIYHICIVNIPCFDHSTNMMGAFQRSMKIVVFKASTMD